MLDVGQIVWVRFNQFYDPPDALCIVLDPVAQMSREQAWSSRTGTCVTVLHPALGAVTMLVDELPNRGGTQELEET